MAEYLPVNVDPKTSFSGGVSLLGEGFFVIDSLETSTPGNPSLRLAKFELYFLWQGTEYLHAELLLLSAGIPLRVMADTTDFMIFHWTQLVFERENTRNGGRWKGKYNGLSHRG